MNAYKDGNGVSTLICALNSNGTTPTRVTASPSTHRLSISEGTSGNDYGITSAVRDGNDVPVWLAVSSVDGKTPVEIYSDSNGNLLIQNN